ncbi:MAG: HD domain-containing protein [Chitinivibrionales bacterium]|nr:HD domain-containing protein [Chitinivibrionales bacterium]
MASEADLMWIKKWFDMYVLQFCMGDERFDSAICLKVHHSKNVALHIFDLSSSLNLGAEDRHTMQIIAFLHDIGRFEQYMKYHTYSDSKSENHAKLGVDIIRKTGVLHRFEPWDRELIETVIAHHNHAMLPESTDSRFLLFLRLLRDADKMDVLRAVTEHFSGLNVNEVIAIGLPESPAVSDVIIESIIHGTTAKVKDMKTQNDLKLLQISWIFDFNFPRTFELVNNRRYLDALAACLPQSKRVMQAIAVAREHLNRMSPKHDSQ